MDTPNLVRWQGAAKPARTVLEGRFTRLEPIDTEKHAGDLFSAVNQPGGSELYRYLFDRPPVDLDAVKDWISRFSQTDDPLFFAVVDRATGRAAGRQALMRIDTEHGVAEIGNILWGAAIARTRVATEAMFLFAEHVFGSLGFRRLEWKCDDRNLASMRAAERFGFQYEGLFHNHMVVKDESRDTAWFAMTDVDWQHSAKGYRAWLNPDNFDKDGRQHASLRSFRSSVEPGAVFWCSSPSMNQVQVGLTAPALDRRGCRCPATCDHGAWQVWPS